MWLDIIGWCLHLGIKSTSFPIYEHLSDSVLSAFFLPKSHQPFKGILNLKHQQISSSFHVPSLKDKDAAKDKNDKSCNIRGKPGAYIGAAH